MLLLIFSAATLTAYAAPAVAPKGGESGKAAIKPGDPRGSEMVRLVLLPADDDDVMPPKGKEAMTAEEVLTIIRWIQKGAPFATAIPATEQ